MSKFLTAESQSPGATAFEKLFAEVERIILGQSRLIDDYLAKLLGKGKNYQELRKGIFLLVEEKSGKPEKDRGQGEARLRELCGPHIGRETSLNKLWGLVDRLIFLKRKLCLDKETVLESFEMESRLVEEYDRLILERINVFTGYGTMESPAGHFK